jgi:hypothetical protein
MLSGYLTGYPPLQLAVLRTAVWLPLLLWLMLRAWQEPRKWRFWIGGAFAYATAFFAGHTQTWLYVTYAMAGWLAILAMGVRRPLDADTPDAAKPRIIGVTVFAVTAAGLVSAQMIPSVEFARLSVRADVDYAYLSGGFPIQDTWQMLLPGVLTHFSPLYVGVVSLGMALFGAAYGISQRDERVPMGGDPVENSHRFQRYAIAYFVATALFGLLASYGDNGFLYPLLYRIAPGWDLFRGQERAAFLVAFGTSMLAGYGLFHVAGASTTFRRRYALLFGAFVTAGVYAFGLLWQLSGRTAVGHWHYLAIAILTLLLGMSVAITVWVDGWSMHRHWLICCLAAANMLLANATTNLENRTPGQAVTLPPEAVALHDAVRSAGLDASGLAARAYNEYRVYEDYGMRTDVEDVWGSSPLRLSRYAMLFEQFPLDRMFRLTGVRHVLTWRKELFEPSDLVAEYPKQDDTTYLHRLREPNPRVWIVTDVVVATDAQAAELLADHAFDLETVAVLASESGYGDWSGRTVMGQVRAERLRANHLQVEVVDSAGGILVVSENWMPGWRVETIECTPAANCEAAVRHDSGMPLLTPVRANLSFIAIALPEGGVRFDLVYDPGSVRAGVAISAATLLILGLAATFRFIETRRRVVT